MWLQHAYTVSYRPALACTGCAVRACTDPVAGRAANLASPPGPSILPLHAATTMASHQSSWSRHSAMLGLRPPRARPRGRAPRCGCGQGAVDSRVGVVHAVGGCSRPVLRAGRAVHRPSCMRIMPWANAASSLPPCPPAPLRLKAAARKSAKDAWAMVQGGSGYAAEVRGLRRRDGVAEVVGCLLSALYTHMKRRQPSTLSGSRANHHAARSCAPRLPPMHRMQVGMQLTDTAQWLMAKGLISASRYASAPACSVPSEPLQGAGAEA